MIDCNLTPTQSIEFTFLHTFVLVFSFFFFFVDYVYYPPPQLLELLWILSLPLVRHLAEGMTPSLEPTVSLTAIGVDEIGPSGLTNQTVRFILFQA
jgi:hypothetical protein